MGLPAFKAVYFAVSLCRCMHPVEQWGCTVRRSGLILKQTSIPGAFLGWVSRTEVQTLDTKGCAHVLLPDASKSKDCISWEAEA